KSEMLGELSAVGVTLAEKPAEDPAPQTGQQSGQENASKTESLSQQSTHSDPGIPDYVYGDIEDINIQEPDGHPDLVAATTTLGVCCGSDTSLYLFQRSESAWHLILAQEAEEYDEVSGAQEMFEYRISPPDSDGRFFVVTANVNPWC